MSANDSNTVQPNTTKSPVAPQGPESQHSQTATCETMDSWLPWPLGPTKIYFGLEATNPIQNGNLQAPDRRILSRQASSPIAKRLEIVICLR